MIRFSTTWKYLKVLWSSSTCVSVALPHLFQSISFFPSLWFFSIYVCNFFLLLIYICFSLFPLIFISLFLSSSSLYVFSSSQSVSVPHFPNSICLSPSFSSLSASLPISNLFLSHSLFVILSVSQSLRNLFQSLCLFLISIYYSHLSLSLSLLPL